MSFPFLTTLLPSASGSVAKAQKLVISQVKYSEPVLGATTAET